MRIRSGIGAAAVVVPLLGAVAGTTTATATGDRHEARAAKPGLHWRLASPAPPPARYGASMVYDAANRQIVLFGGQGSGLVLGDTWTWDKRGWHDVTAESGPPARRDAAMVYDAASHKVLLFGGASSSSQVLGDTWTWDGKRWTEVKTAVTPPARSNAAMVYDAANRKVVLFGGSGTGNSALGDTWIWSGNGQGQASWGALATGLDEVPAARRDPGMVYDEASRQVVLFGGATASSGSTDDATTWVLSPTSKQWAAATSSGPSARRDMGMVYDPTHKRVLLVGGQPGGTETWSWNGSSWTLVDNALESRTNPTLVAHPGYGSMLLIGGRNVQSNGEISDSWRWDGSGWRAVAPHPVEGRYDAAVAYDPAEKRVVLFGGSDFWALGDTWLSDGHKWEQATKNGPPRSDRWKLVYDSERHEMVVFQHQFDFAGGTWTWDGRRWEVPSDVSPPDDPTFGVQPLYAYDKAAKQIVAFFGPSPNFAKGVGLPGKTAYWNGRRWIAPSGPQPMTRTNAAMAYDEASRQVVLFGGTGCPAKGLLGTGAGPADEPPPNTLWYSGTGYCSGTWTWNGHRWSKAGGPQPPDRSNPVMLYDAARRRVVMFGGTGRTQVAGTEIRQGVTSNGTFAMSDTWLWDGRQWRAARLSHPAPAATTNVPAVAFDAAHKQALLYGAPADGQGVQTTGVNAPADRLTYRATWLWNGHDWDNKAKTPDGRDARFVVYDAAVHGVLLGAVNSCPTHQGAANTGVGPDTATTLCPETWLWDGRKWTQLPGMTPSLNRESVAYDERMRSVVVVNNDGLWTWGR